jgi:hypothetical protein
LNDVLDVSCVLMEGALLKMSPGPFPLPRIRSGGALTGAGIFGAGSLENRAEEPVPRLTVRGFLEGRGSSVSGLENYPLVTQGGQLRSSWEPF